MSDSLRPHDSQHARPPCPSPTPGIHSNSHPPSQWCHPVISSSVIPFSFCPQSLPASVFSNESTLCMRWPKYWSFSFSIIPSKEHPGLISLEWTGCISLKSKGLSRIFSAISKLKWMGIGEFNSDGHYIHYSGQESLRRNGVAFIVTRVWSTVFGCNPQNNRMIPICFQGKPFNITVI